MQVPVRKSLFINLITLPESSTNHSHLFANRLSLDACAKQGATELASTYADERQRQSEVCICGSRKY